MKRSEVLTRSAVAGVGIPLAVYLLITAGWGLTLFMGFVGIMVTWELFLLGDAAGVKPFRWIGVVGSLIWMVLAGSLGTLTAMAPWAVGLVVGLFLLVSTLAIWLRWPDGKPTSAIALTLMGVVLGGGCLSFALLVRHLPLTFGGVPPWGLSQGFLFIAFPLAVTWAGDSAAYFGGSLWGKKKLIPAVSPKKTVVGSVAGFATGLVLGIWFGWYFLELHPDPVVSVGIGALLGLILAGGAQIGDLAESVLKREVGVKDSSNLIPGHGGFLDRFDALILNLPLAYLLYQLVGLIQ